jgi:hypothetical protein
MIEVFQCYADYHHFNETGLETDHITRETGRREVNWSKLYRKSTREKRLEKKGKRKAMFHLERCSLLRK